MLRLFDLLCEFQEAIDGMVLDEAQGRQLFTPMKATQAHIQIGQRLTEGSLHRWRAHPGWLRRAGNGSIHIRRVPHDPTGDE